MYSYEFLILDFLGQTQTQKGNFQQNIFLYYNRSQEYSEYTLQQAIDLQKTMDSNMGGTEILKPLKSIYSKSCKQGYPRQVLS